MIKIKQSNHIIYIKHKLKFKNAIKFQIFYVKCFVDFNCLKWQLELVSSILCLISQGQNFIKNKTILSVIKGKEQLSIKQ